MFPKSAAFYDAIYLYKNYAAEAAQVNDLIAQNQHSLDKTAPGATLLDVACGTGHHLYFLREYYQVEGLDLDDDLLKIARERCPDVTFYHGDMVDFDLGKQYDVVTSLFSAIGYVKTIERLNSALRSIARHLLPGGVTIVEPWLMQGQFIPEHVNASYVNLPDLKIARMETSNLEGDISTLNYHYMVGKPAGVEYFTEHHELGVFSDEQYRAAFKSAGLSVSLDMPGLDGRGLYIGVKQ